MVAEHAGLLGEVRGGCWYDQKTEGDGQGGERERTPWALWIEHKNHLGAVLAGTVDISIGVLSSLFAQLRYYLDLR